MASSRINILKTYKLFIGGKFPRTESGRYMTATSPSGEHLAHYCHASRKDLRDAIRSARSASQTWSGMTAFLRSQILYRAAEMLESRRASVVDELVKPSGESPELANREVEASIDRLVSYAGWCDKYGQIFSSVNPVASPHFNFTTPEPTGVAIAFAPDTPALLGLVTVISRIILSGNAVVAIASETAPLPAIALAEVFATSDLPGGVVNILTGKRDELVPWAAEHMDVNAIVDATGEADTLAKLELGAASNLKRVSNQSLSTVEDWYGPEGDDPYPILETVEMKTAWHPAGV